MRVGRLQGSKPAQWYGTFKEIPIEGLTFQQLIDFRCWESKERIAHRANQLSEIMGLKIVVQLVPLQQLLEIAGDDRGAVNYIRHRSTPYHKLLERYDAGDRAILSAIRAKIYSAISAAYPELEKECERQFADRACDCRAAVVGESAAELRERRAEGK
jgi:hypothetical protein